MMQAKDLSFFYGRNQILKDITLDFEAGKLYIILGQNGSGKTTLLHALARLHKAKGSLTLDGIDYAQINRCAFAQKVALLPQERSIPDMTVQELVSAGRYPYSERLGGLGKEDHDIVQAAMHATNTEHFAKRSMKALSGGERQRAYIGMLMAQDTPYVLLDEPTSHLDISCRFEIMELLCSMRDNGKCVVAVLHDPAIALRYADEVILLSEGRVLAVDNPQSIADREYWKRIFHITCHKVVIDGKTEYIAVPIKTP